jgi:AbiV family abortive infection protein
MLNNNAAEVRAQCIANSEQLLTVAERELSHGVDHICFHLALLALEEIGKGILATASFAASHAGKDSTRLVASFDDHVKKLFWAIWGGMFRDNSFTQQAIEESRGLATNLHERRLRYLYIDPENPVPPADRIAKGEAENLIKLVRARLELEKLTKTRETFEEEDLNNLKWFLAATEDAEKRKYIFGSSSIKVLQDVKDGRKWILWLKEIFQKQLDEARELAVQELSRQQPSEKERLDPKYRMRVRIQTPSHSIRNNAFQKWNETVDWIKIYKSERPNLRRFTKGELVIEFTFPKAIPPHALWDHGLFMTKTITTALSVATNGFFWWNLPRDIEKYYEEITDLEASPRGQVKIIVAPTKRLAIDWGEDRFVLDQVAMSEVMLMFGFLMREHKRLAKMLQSYAFGLTLFSKNDIHLRLETNAFEEFFKSFLRALELFGDWDGVADLKEAIHKPFARLDNFDELDRTIQLGLDIDPEKKAAPTITLTDVAAIKLYCDAYLRLKASEHFRALKSDSPSSV